MNPLIAKLEQSVPETQHALDEAKRMSDVVGVLKLTRRLRNQRVLLALLKAHKDKRLDDADVELTVSVP